MLGSNASAWTQIAELRPLIRLDLAPRLAAVGGTPQVDRALQEVAGVVAAEERERDVDVPVEVSARGVDRHELLVGGLRRVGAVVVDRGRRRRKVIARRVQGRSLLTALPVVEAARGGGEVERHADVAERAVSREGLRRVAEGVVGAVRAVQEPRGDRVVAPVVPTVDRPVQSGLVEAHARVVLTQHDVGSRPGVDRHLDLGLPAQAAVLVRADVVREAVPPVDVRAPTRSRVDVGVEAARGARGAGRDPPRAGGEGLAGRRHDAARDRRDQRPVGQPLRRDALGKRALQCGVRAAGRMSSLGIGLRERRRQDHTQGERDRYPLLHQTHPFHRERRERTREHVDG